MATYYTLQERFDKAYCLIVKLHDEMIEVRKDCFRRGELKVCEEIFWEIKGLAKAIAILQEVSRND